MDDKPHGEDLSGKSKKYPDPEDVGAHARVIHPMELAITLRVEREGEQRF